MPRPLATASAMKPPLAPYRGITETARRMARISCARVCAVKKTPAQRSGVSVRAIMPTVIQSRIPSRAPAAARIANTAPPLHWVVARSVRANPTDAAKPIILKCFGLSTAPAAAVARPMVNNSSIAAWPSPAAVMRCSSTRAPSSTGITPSTRSELIPTPMVAPASNPVMGGPIASCTRWSCGAGRSCSLKV